MPQLFQRSSRNCQCLRILRKPAEVSRAAPATGGSAVSAILDGDSGLDMGMRWSRSNGRYRRAFDLFGERALFVCAGITNNQSNQTAEPVAPIQVEITATRRAPSPTQPASQETGWVSVVEDDFSDPDSPWWAITLEEEYSTYYEGGTYHIEVDISDTYYWQSLGYGDLRDVNVEVQMRLVDGYAEDSSMGVLCRQSGQNYYLFEINNAGQSRIRKYTEAEGWENLTDWEYGDSIQPNIWNTIYIECFGEDLIMTVNDVLVARAMDASLTSGDVGLAAGAIPTAGLHVEFDDFKLWEYR